MLQHGDQCMNRPRLSLSFPQSSQVNIQQQNMTMSLVSVSQSPNINFITPNTIDIVQQSQQHNKCQTFVSPRSESSPLQQQQHIFRTSLIPSLPVSASNNDEPIIIESSGSNSSSSNGSSCGPTSIAPNVYFHRVGPSTSSGLVLQQSQQQFRFQQQQQQYQLSEDEPKQLQMRQFSPSFSAQQLLHLQNQQQLRHTSLQAAQQQHRFLTSSQNSQQRPIVLTQQTVNDQMMGDSSLFGSPRNVAGNTIMPLVRLQSLTPKQLSTLLPPGSNIFTQRQLLQHSTSNNLNCSNRNPPASHECSPVLPHQQLAAIQQPHNTKILSDDYYKRKHYLLKKCVKSLAFKNAALCDEVARLNQRIQTVAEDRKLLLQRLMTHEKTKEKRRSSSTVSRKTSKASAANRQTSIITISKGNCIAKLGEISQIGPKSPPGASCSRISVEFDFDDDRDIVRNIVDSVVTSGHFELKAADPLSASTNQS